MKIPKLLLLIVFVFLRYFVYINFSKVGTVEINDRDQSCSQVQENDIYYFLESFFPE